MATLPRYTGTQYRCIDLGRDLCAAGQPIAYRRLDPGRLVTTSRRVGRVTGLRAQELLLQGQQAAPSPNKGTYRAGYAHSGIQGFLEIAAKNVSVRDDDLLG